MAKTYLSKEGFEKLQQEMKALHRQRLDLLDEVNRAAAMGDLRENAEYHAARERLQHVSQRLSELDGRMSDVEFTDDLKVAPDEVRIGAAVTLLDVQAKDECTYTLVGADEADPTKGRLSIASPLAQAMLGKKKGEEFTLKLPRATVNYKIVKVARP